MKRLAVLALVMGCTEPSINVTFRVGGGYRNAITSVGIQIYQPPTGARFGCEDLAFGLVSEEVLRLSNVISLTSSVAQIPLGEVDRVAPKVFVAEGIDGLGRSLVIGCTEVGEIEDATDVVIISEPFKRVTTEQMQSISVAMGTELSIPVGFIVTDVNDQGLENVEVRWAIDGAGGSGSEGVSTSDETGRAAILPKLPTRPGPFVLDVDVRWAEQRPDPVPGFVTPEAQAEQIPGVAIAYRSGRIGPAGEPGFAALVEDQVLPNAFRVVYVYKNGQGATQQRVSQSFVVDTPILGLIESQVVSQRERAIVVGVDDWFEIETDGSTTRKPYPDGPGFTPRSINTFTPCEAGSAPQIVIFYEELLLPTLIGIYNDEGVGQFFGWDFGELVDSGCVTNEGRGFERVVLASQGGLGLLVGILKDTTVFGGFWLALNIGTDFAMDGAKGLMMGSQLVLDDVVVSRVTIRLRGEDFAIVEQQADQAPGLPLFTSGADIDGDDKLDVISLFQRPASVPGAPPTFALWAVLGREHQGVRISGDFDLPTVGLREPQMMVLDFDQDGTNDVIIGERPGQGSQTRFELFSMGEATAE